MQVTLQTIRAGKVASSERVLRFPVERLRLTIYEVHEDCRLRYLEPCHRRRILWAGFEDFYRTSQGFEA